MDTHLWFDYNLLFSTITVLDAAGSTIKQAFFAFVLYSFVSHCFEVVAICCRLHSCCFLVTFFVSSKDDVQVVIIKNKEKRQ